MARGLSSLNPGFFRFHCFITCLSHLPALRDISHTPMARIACFCWKCR